MHKNYFSFHLKSVNAPWQNARYNGFVTSHYNPAVLIIRVYKFL